MSTIFIIRHAEKPNGQQGVTAEGANDPESLTPQGWQRAGALAVFFGSSDGLPAPSNIYASATGKQKIAPHQKIGSNSSRPIETVTPLASKLSIVPNQTFALGDEANLVNEIVKLDGTVLVCWQHEAIPQIATLIVGDGQQIPDPWPSGRFDVVWRFTRSQKEDPWVFSQVCQRLLAGDGSQPIPLN